MKSTVTRRWLRRSAAISVLLVVLSVGFWGLIALHRSLEGNLNSQIALVENRGMERLTWSLIAVVVIFISVCLAIAYKSLDVFNPSVKKQELYWLYVSLVVFIGVLFLQVGPSLIFPHGTTQIIYQQHPVYSLGNAQVSVLLVLLIFGIAISIVKSHSKLSYGIAEVVASVASNFAIITHIDLSGFPHTHFKTSDLLAMGALAYLFSKGISDAVDGVADIKKRRIANAESAKADATAPALSVKDDAAVAPARRTQN